MPIEKAGSSSKRRLIRGYASVGNVLDRQNEVITLGALQKARLDLLENSTIFYEHKHSDEIDVRRRQHEERAKEIAIMAETIHELEHTPGGDAIAQLDRMKLSFAKQYGPVALAKAEKQAGDL